ncbi:MAG: serine protease [Bacteroidetes bacterium CG2_30_33_31]|nr:MAG: serine protease [Bacteroidetes bacterium CG2_30_33_31]
MKQIILLFFISIFALNSQVYSVDIHKKKVYIFDIDEEIAPPITRRMEKAFAEAKAMNADLILIHMNTYGGLVVDADTIRTRILNSKIPIIVFIDNNAASAGALISIACQKIYMRKSANIGAATVVNESAQAMPDKYQSYMRATMRSTAEARGRDPKIAEAMVDEDLFIEGISDSGKVLTFTASEALKNGYCDAIVENVAEVLKAYGYENYTAKTMKVTFLDKCIDFLISPAIHGLLIIIIIGGIYFEMQAPGIGFPSAAAVIAAFLYFMPLYYAGFAANWEILIFVIGVILLILEIFVIPGFGVAGISGIVFIIVGLMLSMLGNVNFDFSNVPFDEISKAFFIVIISIIATIIISFYLTEKVFTSKKFPLSLYATQPHSEGYIATNENLDLLIGKKGIAASILRPAGKVEIDDEIYDAIAIESYIEKGTAVKVIKSSNTQIVVAKS